MGALGAALATMVANLSRRTRRGWDARWEEFSDWADKGHALMRELLHLVDEDTEGVPTASWPCSPCPESTDEEKAARSAALEGGYALRHAGAAPHDEDRLRGCSTWVKAMAEIGNPNSVSDAGVGALVPARCFGRLHQREDQTPPGLRTVPRPISWWPRPRRWPPRRTCASAR